ncbi:hypothetical protein HUG10_04110 [Halorarum halophilum]|uniref:Uncharacterized protein n=1 Tax=Halorarum halophilum TaxID=2743090 RepID=A0A7D5KCM1_9EURY|nr:hypothetical protein [Halobaculum halophilum]QLG26777.1 hypothetical protein HUG10_04110 [Halobaculum halophilum]
MKRRSVLAVLGVGAGGWIGYDRFRSGREGRIFWREMAVDAGGEPGSLIIMTVSRESDGTVSHTIHDEYTDAFDDGTYVSRDLHRALEREFGPDEPYYLVRYGAHDCNGVPGDEGGDAVEVSRKEFNDLRIGDCVKK